MADKQLPGASWDRATKTDILDWIAFYKQPLALRFTQKVLGRFDLELFRDRYTGDYFIMRSSDFDKFMNTDDFNSNFVNTYKYLQRRDLDEVKKSIGLL